MSVEERPPLPVAIPVAIPEPAMQIQFRADGIWGQSSLVITGVVTKDEKDTSGLLDRMTEIMQRERLKAAAAKIREELRVAHAQLREGFYDRAIAQARRALADVDKVLSLAHVAKNRRANYEPRGQDKEARARAAASLAAAIEVKEEVIKGLPLMQYQLDCLECRLAGAAEPEPSDEVKAIIMNLSMPQDQSFRAA